MHNHEVESKFNLERLIVGEIRAAIKSMANNKTGDMDRCIVEVLKCLDDINLREIAEVLTECWTEERVPESMQW